MLRNRIQSGLLLGGAVIVAGIWLPPFSLIMLSMILLYIVMGMKEFYALLTEAKIPNFNRFGTVCGVFLIAATWCSFRWPKLPAAGEWELFALLLITLVIFTRLFPQKNNPKPLETIGGTLLGILYVPFLFNFITKLLIAWDGMADGRGLVIYMVVVVKCTDIGAYFTGRALGKHKLWSRISPKKTWEGFAGGIATALIISVLFQVFSHGNLGVVTFSLVDAVILGILLGVCGTVGDLMESLLKRSAGVKDSSTVIRGMGGVLDVIDSLLFAGPMLYMYARIFLERVS